MGDVQILPGSRHRPPMKKPMWIIVLVLFVCVFLICAYTYPPKSSSACYIFSSENCRSITDWLPPAPAREYTDEEIASRAVVRDILKTPVVLSKNPKIAFMFLSPGSLPFERLWDKFFQVRNCYVLSVTDYFCIILMYCISSCTLILFVNDFFYKQICEQVKHDNCLS